MYALLMVVPYEYWVIFPEEAIWSGLRMTSYSE